MYNELKKQSYDAALEIIEKAKLSKGDILVVGCSTSEVVGSTIGTNSAPEAAEKICEGILDIAGKKGIFVAAQCCEHLNRAIIVEKDAVRDTQPVNVVPQPKAGGSFATALYKSLKNPVAVEEISANAGIDIGFTLIGMHIKKVAVPVRLENNRIGNATVLAARSRPKFIGGARAVYDQDLL